jgi:hypothetical protein
MEFLKRAAKACLDRLVVPPVRHVISRTKSPALFEELERRTASECADYIGEHMVRSLQFEGKRELWNHAIREVSSRELMVEFGVWKGESINHFAARLSPTLVYGFDSFEGLGEDWAGWKETRGSFDLKGATPPVASNVRLVKGRFDATLPRFLRENEGAFSFVHFDSDTYESAKTVLDLAGHRLRPGTIVIFDEYLGFRGWRIGEHRAWREFVEARHVRYEYLAFSEQQVSLRVTGA